MTTPCPACDSSTVEIVSAQRRIPVNSCLLVETSRAAIEFPRGDIDLAVCHDCGFVYNACYDRDLVEYSGRYEETQAFSPRFRQFARALATDWIERYDIRGRTVTEIGCGKAEFLNLMCTIGDNTGIGIDPGVDADRYTADERSRMTLVADFFDPTYGPLDSDVVVCRHTLEHIPDVAAFLRTVREAIGERLDTIVLFELPDVARVLEEGAFWDVYYEHCSYFTAGSLARLFRRCGFEVLDVRMDFDDQYILLDARPVAESAGTATPLAIEDTPARVVEAARSYGAYVDGVVERWKADLEQTHRDGGQVAVWGAGSKAVSFLAHVGPDNVDIAVDINPRKAGRYLPGTEQHVIVPADLPEAKPALVVAMNDIYLDEINTELRDLGVIAELRAV